MDKIDQDGIVFLTKIVTIQAMLTQVGFDLGNFMQLVAEQIQTLTPASGAVVELVDGDDMVYRAATGIVAPFLGLRLPIKNSISGLCVLSNEVLRADDTENDPRVNLEACRKVLARSLVVTPLVYKGVPVGVLKVVSKNPNAFGDTDMHTLQLMAGFIASGLAHQLSFETNNNLLSERTKTLQDLQQAQNKLHHLANYDSLTDLVNRRTFLENLSSQMEKNKRDKKLMAILYLDIDQFKSINDSLGHHIGDELLKAFSGRLKQCVRKYDLVSRLGGDEFVIMLINLDHKEDAVVIAKKILEKMTSEFKVDHTMAKITTSIGLSYYAGENITPEDLLKRADRGLYDAKHAGKNTVRVIE